MAEHPPAAQIDVDWHDVVRFMRQLSHHLRHHLNAAELQAAYLNELAESAEMKEEVKRLREMIAEVTKALQSVTTKMVPVTAMPIPYRCADLLEDIQQKLKSLGTTLEVDWDIEVGESMFEVDPQLLPEAILELFGNAELHGGGDKKIKAAAKIENGEFEFTLREPQKQFNSTTDNWGRVPLRQVGRGHYGLGLNRARMIVEAHGGRFNAEYDAGASNLLTRIVLPLAKPPSA